MGLSVVLQRAETGSGGVGRYLWLLVTLWLVLLWGLWPGWASDPARWFSLVVLAGGIYLFWRAWGRRPAAERVKVGLLFIFSTGVSAIYLFPILLVHEANSDWSLLNWLLVGTVVGLTLNLIWYAGGWAWLKHFVVPACFVLLALPWPTLEAVDLSQNWVRGSIWGGLTLGAQWNMGDASGSGMGGEDVLRRTQTLQVALVMAVFMGEQRALGWVRRLALLAAGGILAVLSMAPGATAWVGKFTGVGGEGEAARYVMLGLVVAGIWLAAWWLTRRRQQRGSGGQPWLGMAGPPKPLSLVATCLLVSWVLLAQSMTALWYWSHERDGSGHHLTWTVSWPPEHQGFQSEAMPPRVRRALLCDEGKVGIWRRPDGSEWTMLFARWRSEGAAVFRVRSHRLGLCLPAAGHARVAEHGLATVRVQMLELSFQTCVLVGEGRNQYVFRCLMDEDAHLGLGIDGGSLSVGEYVQEQDRRRRLRAVLEGRRRRAQQLFEVAITGYASRQDARHALEAALPALIQISG